MDEFLQKGAGLMALFPFFMDISGKCGLIIGGGKHAWEKIERLRPYAPTLQVIAETFLPEIEAVACEKMICKKMDKENDSNYLSPVMSVELIQRRFELSDLDTIPFFVIVATDSKEENRKIATLCKERSILVNAVDDTEACDFIFPCLIAKGKLSVGICTGGASPSVGIQLKKKVEQMLPDRVEEILDWLQEKRPVILQAIPDAKKRFAFHRTLSELCMKENRILTETEFFNMLEEI